MPDARLEGRTRGGGGVALALAFGVRLRRRLRRGAHRVAKGFELRRRRVVQPRAKGFELRRRRRALLAHPLAKLRLRGRRLVQRLGAFGGERARLVESSAQPRLRLRAAGFLLGEFQTPLRLERGDALFSLVRARLERRAARRLALSHLRRLLPRSRLRLGESALGVGARGFLLAAVIRAKRRLRRRRPRLRLRRLGAPFHLRRRESFLRGGAFRLGAFDPRPRARLIRRRAFVRRANQRAKFRLGLGGATRRLVNLRAHASLGARQSGSMRRLGVRRGRHLLLGVRETRADVGELRRRATFRLDGLFPKLRLQRGGVDGGVALQRAFPRGVLRLGEADAKATLRRRGFLARLRQSRSTRRLDRDDSFLRLGELRLQPRLGHRGFHRDDVLRRLSRGGHAERRAGRLRARDPRRGGFEFLARARDAFLGVREAFAKIRRLRRRRFPRVRVALLHLRLERGGVRRRRLLELERDPRLLRLRETRPEFGLGRRRLRRRRGRTRATFPFRVAEFRLRRRRLRLRRRQLGAKRAFRLAESRLSRQRARFPLGGVRQRRRLLAREHLPKFGLHGRVRLELGDATTRLRQRRRRGRK